MMSQAKTISHSLALIAETRSSVIERNLSTLTAALERLDESIDSIFDEHREKAFYVYHPAFGHLADRFDLTQISVEHDGKEPATRRLAKLIGDARRTNARTIIVQPQFANHAARTLAREIGATTVALDPLAYDYPNNMIHIANTIRDALVERP